MMKGRLTAFTTLALVAASLWSVRPAMAFDTGPHYDLCQETMSRMGFNSTAIKITQIQNWYVDFFGATEMEALYGQLSRDMAKLHFDHTPTMDLSSTDKIRNLWTHLAANTQNAIHQAVTEKNKIKLLTYIAISLHAVQDFYSHSNWVEMHERIPWMPYRTDTWYNSLSIAQTLNLKSGHHPSGSAGSDDHGNYMYGINHDGPGPSPTRSRFDEAYVFAYVASMEWLQACKQWADEVDTSFWAQAQTIPVTPGLQADIDLDLQALYRLSEWAGSGGHWKGPGSEYLGGFIDFSGTWVPTMSSFKSLFKNSKIHELITVGLTSAAPFVDGPQITALTSTNDGTGFVKVRTTRVTDLKNNLDTFDEADFYSDIKIGGQTFREAMQMDIKDVAPYWTTIRFVNTASPAIPIRYTLFDEDGGANGLDDHVDINPSNAKMDLDFTFDFWSQNLTGDINGLHNVTPVSSSGNKESKDRGRVQFTVTSSLLDNVHTQPKKQMKVTVTPTIVTIPVLKVKGNGGWQLIEQSKLVGVTINAVDAMTNLPITGYIYDKAPFSGTTFVGTSGSTFNYTFWSGGASHNEGFRVYAPGYDSAVANVWVERVVP